MADKLLWKICGRLPGMENDMRFSSLDTDSTDTVFVCDIANACVQVFSFYGKYYGCLIRKGDRNIGCPRSITFNSTYATGGMEILHELDDGNLHVITFELGRRL